VGFALDAKGIRETVEQEEILKCCYSFALNDTFSDVDLPSIKLIGSARLGVSVSAVIVKAMFGVA
jgi:hypothetical protein